MTTHLWYPYTPMTESGPLRPPLHIQAAEGSYLIDETGRRYIDGNGSWWVSNLGHQHPKLVAALKRQADQMCHISLAGITHGPAEQLAEALTRVAPAGLTRVFYSDDGSTAVEVAARMALQYHRQTGNSQRTRFIALQHAFHGETVACASFSDMPEFHQSLGSIAFACDRIPSPADSEGESLAVLEKLISNCEEYAALIIEPLVQGAGGMKMHSPECLKKVRQLTEKYGVILIADEVFVGYGRTGRMWACEHADITPDILCTAKGFTGGLMPMAATLASEAIFSAFIEDECETGRTLRYGHSYCGNPLACAVALEVLSIYEDEHVLEGVRERTNALQHGIDALAGIDGVQNPRRTGLIGAVDLPPQQYAGYDDPAGWRVYDEALSRGAYLRPLGNVLYFVPALNMPPDVITEMLDIAKEAVLSALKAG